VRWEGTVPAGARVEAAARSGNTAEPDGTWSPWAPVAAGDPDGASPAVPPARWFQLRLELTGSPEGSPVVRRVESVFLPRNRTPRLRRVEVEPAGVALTPAPPMASPGAGPQVTEDPVSRRALRAAGRRPVVPPRRAYETGARSFVWEAQDPDDDALVFALEIRRHGQDAWIPFASDVEASFYSWDSRSLPDGLYEVRVTADDRRDNAAGRNLVSRQTSDPFRVDHTPPRVEALGLEGRGSSRRARFRAVDPGGRVAAVEFAVDALAWTRLDPEDGVADGSEESYVLPVPEGAWGTLRLRVTDSVGNVGGTALPLPPP
jgi:hypothetical protein